MDNRFTVKRGKGVLDKHLLSYPKESIQREVFFKLSNQKILCNVEVIYFEYKRTFLKIREVIK